MNPAPSPKANRTQLILVASMFVTGAGGAASRMALILVYLTSSSSLVISALIVVVDAVPRALLSKPIGRLVRHLGARRSIGLGLTMEAAFSLLAALMIHWSAWALLGVLLFRTAFSALGLVALQSSVPSLFVDRERIIKCNFLIGLASAAAVAVGPVIGALFSTLGGVSLLLVIDGVTSLLAVVGLIMVIPRGLAWRPPPTPETGAGVGDGMGRGLTANALAVAAGGVMNVILPLFLVVMLGMSSERAALVLGSFGIGAIGVTLSAATLRRSAPPGLMVRIGLGLQCLGFLAVSLHFPIPEVWIVAAGAGSALRAVGILGWTQLHDPDRVPENVSRLQGTTSLGLVIGTLIGAAAVSTLAFAPMYAVAISVCANIMTIGQFRLTRQSAKESVANSA